jgi:hypothetical protein
VLTCAVRRVQFHTLAVIDTIGRELRGFRQAAVSLNEGVALLGSRDTYARMRMLEDRVLSLTGALRSAAAQRDPVDAEDEEQEGDEDAENSDDDSSPDMEE